MLDWLRKTSAGRRVVVLAFIALGVVVAVLGFREDADDYTKFVDEYPALGIPNGKNVLSNLPFLIVGAWALFVVWRRKDSTFCARAPELAFGLGVLVTAFGSAWFHLRPDGPLRLLGDRTPMTVAFTGLSVALLDDYFFRGTRRWLIVPFLALGFASVAVWHCSSWLAPYAAVQALPLAIVAAVAVVEGLGGRRERALFVALVLYGLAKLTEARDKELWEALDETISGHTLKHFAAAAASLWLIPVIAAPAPSRSDPSKGGIFGP
jgi:hypothetical protein